MEKRSLLLSRVAGSASRRKVLRRVCPAIDQRDDVIFARRRFATEDAGIVGDEGGVLVTFERPHSEESSPTSLSRRFDSLGITLILLAATRLILRLLRPVASLLALTLAFRILRVCDLLSRGAVALLPGVHVRVTRSRDPHALGYAGFAVSGPPVPVVPVTVKLRKRLDFAAVPTTFHVLPFGSVAGRIVARIPAGWFGSTSSPPGFL